MKNLLKYTVLRTEKEAIDLFIASGYNESIPIIGFEQSFCLFLTTKQIKYDADLFDPRAMVELEKTYTQMIATPDITTEQMILETKKMIDKSDERIKVSKEMLNV